MMQGIVNQNCEAILPGTSCTFKIYLAVVIWDGQYCEIYVNESETFPLIGMRLLRGYDLRIQAIEGRTVAIEALI
jgi:predicted aspartyl protease